MISGLVEITGRDVTSTSSSRNSGDIRIIGLDPGGPRRCGESPILIGARDHKKGYVGGSSGLQHGVDVRVGGVGATWSPREVTILLSAIKGHDNEVALRSGSLGRDEVECRLISDCRRDTVQADGLGGFHRVARIRRN